MYRLLISVLSQPTERRTRLLVETVVRLLRAGRVGSLVGLLTSVLFGRDYYLALLAGWGDEVVNRTIGRHRMYLHADDAGLSRTLFTFGVHESQSLAAFRRELESVAAERSDATVLETARTSVTSRSSRSRFSDRTRPSTRSSRIPRTSRSSG